MELLVHVSTSGHLLVACLQVVVAVPFVGNDYFCESVTTPSNWQAPYHFHPNAPLWDGQVCEGGGRCCQLNNPPWFTKKLTTPTTDGIEVRLCLTGYPTTSNVALELLELYIQ